MCKHPSMERVCPCISSNMCLSLSLERACADIHMVCVYTIFSACTCIYPYISLPQHAPAWKHVCMSLLLYPLPATDEDIQPLEPSLFRICQESPPTHLQHIHMPSRILYEYGSIFRICLSPGVSSLYMYRDQ